MATPASTTANRQIARAAGTVMLAYALSQVLGLVRWFMMTRYYGTGPEADAFNAARVLSDILFQLIAGGVLAGVVLAMVVSRVLRSFLFGVQPSDPVTLMVVGALFAGVALLACWGPVRRATMIDALEALRYE